MTTANVLDPTDHLTEIGQALIRLGENRDAIPELRAALDRDDHGALTDILGRLGIEPPGDLCYPYVTVLILVMTCSWVRHCTWVPRPPKGEPQEGEDVRESLASPIDGDQLLQILQKLGYLRCDWRLECGYEFKRLEKFVQGMCPPGTF